MDGIRKIMIHLWFDTEAEEASEFYHKTFENSRILSKRVIPGTPSGDVESFMEIEDISLMLLSAGPYFKLNPSVSFMISCTDKDEVRKYWNAFMEGGKGGGYPRPRQTLHRQQHAPACPVPAVAATGNAGRAERFLRFFEWLS